MNRLWTERLHGFLERHVVEPLSELRERNLHVANSVIILFIYHLLFLYLKFNFAFYAFFSTTCCKDVTLALASSSPTSLLVCTVNPTSSNSNYQKGCYAAVLSHHSSMFTVQCLLITIFSIYSLPHCFQRTE